MTSALPTPRFRRDSSRLSQAAWRACTWACAAGLSLLFQACGGGGSASDTSSTLTHAAVASSAASITTTARVTALKASTAPARVGPAPVCVLPWGPDLNAVFGTDLEIITGDGGCDNLIAAHRRFAQLLVFWFNDVGGSAVVPLLYPPGYTPLNPDPLQDFLGRIVEFTYVLQPSGRTITYTAHQLRHHLYASTLGAVFGGSGQFPTEWSGLRAVAVLPSLPPLRPGDYSVTVSATFSQDFCDGTSDDPLTCLPAGTLAFYSREFTAVAAH